MTSTTPSTSRVCFRNTSHCTLFNWDFLKTDFGMNCDLRWTEKQRRDLQPLLRYLAYSAIAIRRWCLRFPTSGGFHQIASSQSTHFLSKDSVWEDWRTLGKIRGNHQPPPLKNPIKLCDDKIPSLEIHTKFNRDPYQVVRFFSRCFSWTATMGQY